MAGPGQPVLWSKEALADLDGIWNHYFQVAGRNTADKVVREIVKATSILQHYPFAGRSRDEVRHGLRSVTASPHIVFYRVTGATAEIARVLDGRQEIKSIFTAPR
jgi:toxin ParE1/3/4